MAEDKIKTLEFIQDYRTLQLLWDSKHKDYPNNAKRNEALYALGHKHNCDVKTVKNKIKSLRSYFSKEHQKVLAKQSDPETRDYESAWFAYESLSFILDSSKENLFNTSTVTQDERTDSHASRSSKDEPPEPIRKKRNIYEIMIQNKKEDAYTRSIMYKKEKLNRSIIKTPENNDKDECSTFGQLIACKLRKLNPRNRLLAERRINDIFFDLELGEIDSVTEDPLPDTEDTSNLESVDDKSMLNIQPFLTYND